MGFHLPHIESGLEEDSKMMVRHDEDLEEDTQISMHFAQFEGTLMPIHASTVKSPICICIPTIGFRGVDVCAETTLIITNASQNFVWEGYGLRLRIPMNCLPSEIEQCIINIKASVSGQYEFPDNTQPASAVFWLRCEPRCKFTLPISVEIQHCGKSRDVSKLSLVKASCSQVELPYQFEKLQNSHFYDEDSFSYGANELTSFSGVGVTQDESEEKEYVARLFYHSEKKSAHQIDLVVTWNIETHLTVRTKLMSLMLYVTLFIMPITGCG